jgi:hypothetical protein
MLVTDVGFLAYWAVIFFSLLPADLLYKDHDKPIMVAWNWSFAPIDILASLSGLSAIWLSKRNPALAYILLITSIIFTFCAGTMAISFWWIQGEFELIWWAPNIYLIVWSVYAFFVVLQPRFLQP